MEQNCFSAAFQYNDHSAMDEIILEKIQQGIIILNERFNIMYLNPWAEKVTLYKKNEIDHIDKMLMTDNQSVMLDIFRSAEETGTYEGELFFKRKSGEIYPVWVHITSSKNNERFPRYILFFLDITEQKRVQMKQKLAEKVLQTTSEGVLVTDANGFIIKVNAAFELVTGYTSEEAIGKNPKILQSGIHGKEFYDQMWSAVLNKGNWQGEIWNKRKNGEIYPEWMNLNSIKDETGNITNYIAVFSDITDRKHAEEQLRNLAHYDSLTGVANRYSLQKRLKSLIRTAEKYNQQMAILFLDLNRFKYVNDNLGHSFGDILLKEVSARIKDLIKNKDMIARLGGDEFIIVLPNIKHAKEGVFMAQKINKALSSPFMLGNREVFISTSIGISLYPMDGKDMETLLSSADKAMFKAKADSSPFEFYHEDMHKNESRRMLLENYLRKALENEEFYLVYHPQIDLQTNEIIGIEALLRWKQAELGHVSPAEFIPLAEETGLIVPISEWLIEKACEDVKKIHLETNKNIKICINISALHFNQMHFVHSIQEIVQRTNINPNYIELELTESMIMPKAKESIDKLVKIKKLGIKLSIDDFGTGYSSLSYLNRFPLDILKIDQSFVRGMSAYKDDSSIVEAIIMMGHRLNLKVVAEGVENKKQLEFLKSQSCDYIQGFYITKPLPLQELTDFLNDWEWQYVK